VTIFATIEHSGSREAMKTMGWGIGTHPGPIMLSQLNGSAPRADRPVWIHLSDAEMGWLRANCAGHRIVTTSRHVDDIAKSWLSRGKDLALLDEQVANHKAIIEMGAWVIHLGSNA
jgi:hypothetical protein